MPTTTPTPSQERRKQILSRLHRWDYYAGAVVAGTSGAAHIARVHNTDEMEDYTDTFGALIAASPEMYRALKRVVQWMDANGYPSDDQSFGARAAIARAEGQE